MAGAVRCGQAARTLIWDAVLDFPPMPFDGGLRLETPIKLLSAVIGVPKRAGAVVCNRSGALYNERLNLSIGASHSDVGCQCVVVKCSPL